MRTWLTLETWADRLPEHTRAQIAKLLTEANEELEDIPWTEAGADYVDTVRVRIRPSEWRNIYPVQSRGA